jgi:predicted aminopeptidase
MGRVLLRAAKWTLAGLLIIACVLVILYFELVVYGLRQAGGQLHIIWNAKPVEHYLNDPGFPDSLKVKLRLVEEVRQFAIDSLGLKDTRNYRTLYDQKGKELLWVVTASEPFQLKEKEWKFPVLGAVPYKGFFNQELALKEQQKLEAEGWDVNVRNPGGWSTLGWFTDPILSNMLLRKEGDLASLIIHEMAHSTIFVKDSVEFNENLASFIGDRGAELFLIFRFGEESNEYQQFVREDRDFIRYADHILRGCDYLDSVYTSFADLAVEEKVRLKKEAILMIVQSSDSLSFEALTVPTQKYLQQLPNNAYFMSFRRYQSRQDDFWDEWRSGFNSDLRAYIKELAKRHPFL